MDAVLQEKKNTVVSVRLNAEEAENFKTYAEFKNIPLSTLFKQALEEMIDDEFDMEAIREYEADIKSGKEIKGIPLEEIEKELGIECTE